MKNVAFIPVRGGSKSIPLKNIKEICGKPLVYWTIKAACECKDINEVYVSTDSDKIKEVILKNCIGEKYSKLKIINRSKETATDSASTELAMLEFANLYEFKNIVLIQATSPLLDQKDLTKGFEIYNENGIDSVLSVVRQKRFNWKTNNDGSVEALNYDIYKRPRRQDFEGYLTENGAFYITSKELLLKTKNRISGRIKAVEMKEESFFEIDEPSDWIIIESIMKKNQVREYDLSKIKMFLTDCDGCLTDGGMYYSENGDELKKFNTRDGMGFQMLRKNGIICGIITGEDKSLNKKRAEKLKLDIIEQGISNKMEVVKNICKKYNISLENIAYIGDDINDLGVIKSVGFAACPADAVKEVIDNVDYIAKSKGGKGVIREVSELILN